MRVAGKYHISEDFESILKANIPDYLTETVFHYTPFEGMKGIIEKSELWLSERNYMNDVADEKYIRQIVKNLLKTPNGIAFEGSLLDTHFIDKRPQYIFSTATEADVAHQWLNYGKGSPFCIEFYRNGLEDLINEFASNEWKNGKHIYQDAYLSSPVFYEDEYNELVTLFTKKYKDTLLEYMGELCPDQNKIKELDNARSDFHLLYDCYKQRGFYAEHEYRFVIHSDRLPEYRLKNDFLLPYLILKKNKLPIKSIIIGPYSHDMAMKETLKKFLEKNGYDNIIIKYSKLNMRH
ncbi:MAG: DUF2971 domain-containing protein [Spirochaetota bacterium]|jgi:hypothetical protein|nr:DUF2971 domain-containing protein [Spirochaetota bacterium]